MLMNRAQRDALMLLLRTCSIFSLLIFALHLDANARENSIGTPEDTAYLDECKNLKWRSDEAKSVNRFSFLSDLFFEDTQKWKTFSDFPKIENDSLYNEVSTRLINSLVTSSPGTYLTDPEQQKIASSRIFDSFRYIPIFLDQKIIYSGPLLVVDGNMVSLLPTQTDLSPLHVTNGRLLRIKPNPALNTEYVAVHWNYMSGSSEEFFTRGDLKPFGDSEEVKSSGLLCIPEKAKVIRVETDIVYQTSINARFSPNIDTSNYFMIMNPGGSNVLTEYKGRKTNILMAYEGNSQNKWILIQFNYKKNDKDILSSQIGWIEFDQLPLDHNRRKLIEKSLQD